MTRKEPPDAEIVSALVSYVESDTYPTSEAVASAKLPINALPALLDAIRKGQESVKEELRALSRSAAATLDSWIATASGLQRDMAGSKAEARSLLSEASVSASLEAACDDSRAKVGLLQRELQFSGALAGALEQLQVATGLLDKARECEADNELAAAAREIANARRAIDGLDGLKESRVGRLIRRRAGLQREALVVRVAEHWGRLCRAEQPERRISLLQEVVVEGVEVAMGDVVEAMRELGTLEQHVSRLYRELDHLLIDARFSTAADGATAQLHFTDTAVSAVGRREGHDLAALTMDVQRLVVFLEKRLPPEPGRLLLEKLLPNLLVKIVHEQLDPSVPTSVEELAGYADSLKHIHELAEFTKQTGVAIPSDGDLSEWIERLPQTWLAKRKEAALDALRSQCYEAVKVTKVAEKVETQIVRSDDVMLGGPDGEEQHDEGWGEEWGDEGTEEQKVAPKHGAVDEEDASGWGWGEGDGDGDGDDALEDSKDTSATKTAVIPEAKPDKQAEAKPAKLNGGSQHGDDEDGEGWGWGEAETTEDTQAPVPHPTSSTKPPRSPTKPKPVTHQEITLRETFAITAIPSTLLDLISSLLSSASLLSSPTFPLPALRASAAALSPTPVLLLALYRATARTYYTFSPVAELLLYNDCSSLISQLDALRATLPASHPFGRRLPKALDTETRALASFARLAYGREMDAQRTLLSDLLSGTSGFAACTSGANARAYSGAIADVVARLRELDALWDGVLCLSARRQAIGALLGHVAARLVGDVLELAGEVSGISEPESQLLKRWFDEVAALSELFAVPAADADADAGSAGKPGATAVLGRAEPGSRDGDGDGAAEDRTSLVHVYTPGWLRFVYLGEILEASLADIRYLWSEGGLREDFLAEEVVEMIEALFAESEHRREAIRMIRRG